MSTMTDTSLPLRFPVRRDRWDTVKFFGQFISPRFLFSTFAVGYSIHLLSNDLSSLVGWLMLAYGTTNVLLEAARMAVHVWMRYVEEYIMTADALILVYGPFRPQVKFSDIASLDPIKGGRIFKDLKPANRIVFRSGRARSAVDGFIDFRWNRTRGTVDVFPLNNELFVEELAARCPHLAREGSRMRVKVDESSSYPEYGASKA